MSVKIPILKIEGILVASIQVALDDRAVEAFQEDLLRSIVDTGAAGVIVDLTGVDVMDSFMAKSLSDISGSARLLGADVAIVGMRPAVALTLVQMGLTIRGAVTALNLEKGLAMLRRRSADADDAQSDRNGEPDAARGNRASEHTEHDA